MKKALAAKPLKRRNKFKRWLPLILIMLPGLIYLVINNYIPMAGLVIAFKKIDFSVGIFKSKWVGLENFKFLFRSPDAWTITRNTIAYNLLFIFFDTVCGIGLAVGLNSLRSSKIRSLHQSILLLPYLISWVIVAYLVYAFFSPTTGIVNSVRETFGAKMVNWYTEAGAWPAILLIVHLWKGIGFSTIIYMASLVGIGKDYYEAAALDGASAWKQFTKITLPELKPTITTLVLLSLGRMFYSDFGLFYQVPMNNGMLYKATNTIDTYVYNALMNSGDISMSAAAGCFQSIVGFICIMTVNKIVRKVDKEQALF